MKLTDTLTGTKRDFTPLNNIVTMYVCGPNLYGPCHVGHALSFIVFDVLKKEKDWLSKFEPGYRYKTPLKTGKESDDRPIFANFRELSIKLDKHL